MQMALGTVLVHAAHPALENRVEALNGVGADHVAAFVADVFYAGVINGRMTGELFSEPAIPACLIGINIGLARNVGLDDGHDVGDASAFDVETASRATTLHKGKHGGSARSFHVE